MTGSPVTSALLAVTELEQRHGGAGDLLGRSLSPRRVGDPHRARAFGLRTRTNNPVRTSADPRSVRRLGGRDRIVRESAVSRGLGPGIAVRVPVAMVVARPVVALSVGDAGVTKGDTTSNLLVGASAPSTPPKKFGPFVRCQSAVHAERDLLGAGLYAHREVEALALDTAPQAVPPSHLIGHGASARRREEQFRVSLAARSILLPERRSVRPGHATNLPSLPQPAAYCAPFPTFGSRDGPRSGLVGRRRKPKDPGPASWWSCRSRRPRAGLVSRELSVLQRQLRLQRGYGPIGSRPGRRR